MAEPNESRASEIQSRLAELDAEKKRLLRELASVKIPAAKKEKYGTRATPTPQPGG